MNAIRLLLSIVALLLLLSCQEQVPRPVVRLLPLPANAKEQTGVFILTSKTRIEINSNTTEVHQIANQLNQHLEEYFGFSNAITTGEGDRDAITIKLNDALEIGKEAYKLTVTKKMIHLEAASTNGLFYGIQTLMQLMPSSPKKQTQVIIPTIEISDAPRFAWRGLQFDVSRHFFPKEFIKKLLDEMAMHKLNMFHWHLADDQGWRIEIRKYPKLTEVGSIRKSSPIGHVNQIFGNDTLSYGGFYTQSDIREIVSYAKERYITIVPEISMPGHTLSALASYPELGCTEAPYQVGTRWGLFSDTFCPGKENTYRFVKDVFEEVSELFPDQYIHFGGSECSESRWENCSSCQNRMKSDSLEYVHQLHNYFAKRVAGIIDTLGKKPVAYDEVIRDTTYKSGVVFSWRSIEPGIKAARRKIETVMTPAKFCNFNQFQNNPREAPLAVGGMLTLEQVYKFDPVPDTLARRDIKYIIGAQANLYTEYVKNREVAEYMLYPRLAAMSEVLWSTKASRNYKWFLKRLNEQVKRYDAHGIIYCKSDLKSEIY